MRTYDVYIVSLDDIEDFRFDAYDAARFYREISRDVFQVLQSLHYNSYFSPAPGSVVAITPHRKDSPRFIDINDCLSWSEVLFCEWGYHIKVYDRKSNRFRVYRF